MRSVSNTTFFFSKASLREKGPDYYQNGMQFLYWSYGSLSKKDWMNSCWDDGSTLKTSEPVNKLFFEPPKGFGLFETN